MKKRTFLRHTSLIAAGATLAPWACKPPDKNIEMIAPGKNWAGNLSYHAKNLYTPATAEEAKDFLARHQNVRPLGTRHSFSSIADSNDQMMSSQHFNAVISIDTATNTVTVGSGIRYGELALALQEKGYAIHNLASLPHISVAGACSTATHGSGDENGNLASIVRSLDIMKGDGSTVTLQRGDADFDGAVVGLGALGFITRMTLDIQPTYQVQQEIFEHLPLAAAVENFDAIFSSAYSVSFFTDYNQEEINQVWLKRRLPGSEALAPIEDFYGAVAATRNMHPIAVNSAENCTDQMAVPGHWHERLPHFKLDFTPSNGDELQSEFFVDRALAPQVLQVIQGMSDRITPLLYISEVRSIKADNYWMSTAQGGDKIAFHFTWKPNGAGVSALLPDLEKALEPFNARPHWAKLFHMGHERLSQLYPQMSAFKDLVQRYDPAGKFQNDYLRKVLG